MHEPVLVFEVTRCSQKFPLPGRSRMRRFQLGQQGLKTPTRVKRAQLLPVRSTHSETSQFKIAGQIRVQADELLVAPHVPFSRLEIRANAIRLHLIESRIQLIDVAKLLQQIRSSLWPHSRHARNVVHGISDET